MGERFTIDNLVIEVTRRCNASCEHCMRGDAENLDMSLSYVESLFSKVNRINDITFTGGEPSLAVDKLFSILKIAKKYEVDIGSFYLATNAIKVPDAFIMALVKWYLYCDGNEVTMVNWSNDNFHDIPKENIKKLSVLSFATPKYSDDSEPGILAEGRGADFGHCHYPTSHLEFEKSDEGVVNIFDGALYLNCEGNLIAGCDWSFATQRDEEYNVIICPVEKLSYAALGKWEARVQDDD